MTICIIKLELCLFHYPVLNLFKELFIIDIQYQEFHYFAFREATSVSNDITMRMLLPLRLVLVAASLLLATTTANIHLHLHSDSAKHFAISERQQAIAGIEASLLSLLGFAKRPKPQGQAYVPESLKKLFVKQNTIGMADIAKPGIHARSANTVRSFSHVGKYL